MTEFLFQYPFWKSIDPTEWAQQWAGVYAADAEDERVYQELKAKNGILDGEDFEQIGRWKEACLGKDNNRWKTLTTAAYDVWMEAKAKKPGCPDGEDVANFLKEWSERKYDAGKDKKGGILKHSFGLARATTLLHFISKGDEYPIFDSNVNKAMKRLGSPIKYKIDDYLNSFPPLFSELMRQCNVLGRDLDQALSNYGGKTIPIEKIATG